MLAVVTIPQIAIVIGVVALILSICCRPIRKATGLLFIICGIVSCLSFFGIPIGLLLIFIGGVLLFI